MKKYVYAGIISPFTRKLGRENPKMYYLIAIGCALLFGAVLALTNKKTAQNALFGKIVSVVFLCVFVARYYSYIEYPIDNVIGLSSGPDGAAATFFSLLSVWFAAAALCILVLKPFFPGVTILKTLTKYFCLPAYVFATAMIYFNVRLLMGPDFWNGVRFPVIMYALECGLGIAVSAWEWVKSPVFDKPDRRSYKTVLALLAMLLCAIPSYAFQVVLGLGPATWVVDDLTVTHRLFLYMGLIIPLAIYFALREKDYEEKRFAMTYMSIALLITFCTRYKYDTFLEPWSWPLHLCNTAMFVVPLCLVFNMKRLFYFTYFINVMGAFFAMAMPNYDSVNITQWALVNFWVNHYPAFFMPLLLVALRVFERPKIKQFYHSMAAFFVYFAVVLVLNPLFANFGHEVDFFFLNSDFIPDKFGTWAENMFAITADVKIGSISLTFHPLYQLAFFLVYVGIAFGIWFVYEQFFRLADSHYDMLLRKRKIRQDKIALASALNGRGTDQPMDIKAGTKLELKHFSKKYATSKNYAVSDANLTVKGGEIFGFLGPNGAGKSTIIKSIVGIQPISEGAIEVCGYDCEKQPRQAKAQIGFVPDHYALYEKLTGREYINYIADIYDVPNDERSKRISEMVSLFELEGSFDCSMKTYSHGMKQKITIMAALVHNPRLWILDEPLTGLDPNSIFQVKECMRRHAENGNIVFFSSHIIDVVERICDRIAIIKKGKILCVKTIEEIEAICPLEEFYMKMINDEEFSSKIIAESKQANGAAADGFGA